MNADVHTLAGAYALDALPPDEAADFAEHLQHCTTCRQEVAELQVTAGRLGDAAAEAPPEHLRRRVLEAAQHTRQMAPVVTRLDRASRRRGRLARFAAAAAAAVLLVAGGVGVAELLDDEPQGQVAAIMQAPDADSVTVDVQGGGTLIVVSSRERSEAVVMSEDLPRLEPDEDYQLWLMDTAGNPRPAGVMIDDTRPTSLHVVEGLRSGDRIAMTREPVGGSEQPTSAPLALAQGV